MSDHDEHFDELFAGLRAHADHARLAPGTDLRARGTRRRRNRTALSLAAVAFAVILLGLGTGMAVGATRRPTAPVAGSPSATAAASSTPDATPSSPAPTGSPSSTATGPADGCLASTLGDEESGQDAAAGSAYLTLRLRNVSGHSCRLAVPTLWGTANGKVVKLPQHTENPRTVTVPAGERAQLVIRTANGYGGWGPNDPACAHPATYSPVQLDLGTGARYVTHVSLQILCSDAGVIGWELLPHACSASDIGGVAALTKSTGPGNYLDITITNHGSTACTTSSLPRLRYLTGGASHEQSADQGDPLTLQPGDKAHFQVFSATPSCASPPTAPELQLAGGWVPVQGSVSLPCGELSVSNWIY